MLFILLTHSGLAMLTKGALKFIETISKGGRGKLSIPALREALNQFGGWRVEPIATSYKITGSNYNDVSEWFSEEHLNRAYFSLSPDFGTKIDWKAGSAWGAPNLKPIKIDQFFKKSSSQPKNPERGIIYSAQVEFDKKFDQQEGGRQKIELDTKKIWIGADGFLITAPNGNSFEQPEKLSRNKFEWDGFTSGSLWSFLYKNGAKDQAEKFLDKADSAAINRVVRPSATMRTLENTGTCPACFRNVKMTSGVGKPVILAHGYEVPKWYRGRTKACSGVGFQPFEVSVEGTVHYLKKYLEPSLRGSIGILKVLNAGPPMITKIRSGMKPQVYDYGDPKYDQEIKIQKAAVASEIREMTEAVERYKILIRNWETSDLPKGIGEASIVEMIDFLTV